MDARERAEKIGVAAFDAQHFEHAMWPDLTEETRERATRSGLAAVNEAYRIDRVLELVEAAEIMGDHLVHMQRSPQQGTAYQRLVIAAARVREAMGNTTPRDGGETGGEQHGSLRGHGERCWIPLRHGREQDDG